MAAECGATHRHPRRGPGTRRRRVVQRAAQRAPRLVRSQERQGRTDRAGIGLVAARCDPGARQGSLAHRWRSAGDRASELARPPGAAVQAARRHAVRQPQYVRLRWRRRLVVHRPVGRDRQGHRQDRRGHGQGCAARTRPIRHLRHAARRCLVLLVGQQLHRTDRSEERRVAHRRAANQGAGCAPRVERQPRPHLGQRMELGQRVDARPARAGGRAVCGRPGSCPATARAPMPCMSTTKTWCG